MRNKSLLFLLAAGLVLSLTGCEKEPEAKKGDAQEVRFTIATANPETKTAYTNEGTYDANGNPIWERIDWVKGDPLLIWSDYAIDRVGGNAHAANYVVGDPITIHNESAPYPNQSWAIIKDNADLGLIYDDNHKGSYKFWSIYPADAAIDPAPTGGTETANQVSYKIAGTADLTSAETASGAKTISAEGTSVTIDTLALKPDMTKAVMLAAVEIAEYNGEVILKYYPAFTAFEYTMVAQGEDVNLTKVVIKSASNLAGTVTATVKEGQRNGASGNVIGASTYSVADGAAKEITVNLPANTQITTTKQLTFTVFALPQDITGMTLEFYNDDLKIATGTLQKKVGSENQDITFAACKKHRIYGLAVPGGKWHLYLEADVLDWIDYYGENTQGDMQYGEATEDGVVISASSLEFVQGTAAGSSRTNATLETSAGSVETMTAYFSVYSPTNATWRITMKGSNPDSFTLASDNATVEGHKSVSGVDAYIEGAVTDRVIFTVAPNSGASSGDSVELWFTVSCNGKEYSLHSEVTRSSSPLTVKMP